LLNENCHVTPGGGGPNQCHQMTHGGKVSRIIWMAPNPFQIQQKTHINCMRQQKGCGFLKTQDLQNL